MLSVIGAASKRAAWSINRASVASASAELTCSSGMIRTPRSFA